MKSEQSLEERAEREMKELAKLFKTASVITEDDDIDTSNKGTIGSHYSKERIESDIDALRRELPMEVSNALSHGDVSKPSTTQSEPTFVLTPEIFDKKYSKQSIISMKSENGFSASFRSKLKEMCFLFEKEQSALKLKLLDSIVSLLNWLGQFTRQMCPFQTQLCVERTLSDWQLTCTSRTFIDSLISGVVEILSCNNIQVAIRSLAVRAAMLALEVFGQSSIAEEKSWLILVNICYIDVHVAVSSIIRKRDTEIDIASFVTSCRFLEYVITFLTDEDHQLVACNGSRRLVSVSPDTLTSLIKLLANLFDDIVSYFNEIDFEISTDCCYTLLPLLELLIDGIDAPKSKEIRDKLITLGVTEA